jgi:hypothetical protein
MESDEPNDREVFAQNDSVQGFFRSPLGLISQLSGFEFPAGERKRPTQVKREIPGMRGRTSNQTTRKRTKVTKLSMLELYAPCLGNREQETGNREQETGNREQGLGNRR